MEEELGKWGRKALQHRAEQASALRRQRRTLGMPRWRAVQAEERYCFSAG